MVADHDPTVEGDLSNQFAPRMSVNLLQRVSLGWIYIEDFLQKIFEVV